MASEETRKLTLLTQVDERTIRRSIALTRQLAGETEELTDSYAEQEDQIGRTADGQQVLSRRAQSEIGSIRQRVAALKLEIAARRQQLGIIEDVNRESTKTPTTGTSTRAGVNTFERVGGAEAGLSSIAAVTSIGGNNVISEALRGLADVVGTFEQLPKLAQAVTGSQQALATATTTVGTASSAAAPGLVGVATALGPIAIIGVAVATALALVTQELNQGKEAAQQRIEIDRQLAELQVRGGQEEIKAALEQAELERQILEARGEALGEQFREIREQASLSDVGELNEVVKTYHELDEAISTNEQLIKELTLALDANATAAQDAAKGQEELARLTVDKIQRETEARLRAEELGASGSRESADARLESIAREKAALEDQRKSLEALADRSEAGRDALNQVNERLAALSREQRLIQETALPLIAAREREAAAIKRTQDALARNIQFRVATGERAGDIRQARDTFIADIAQIEQELGEKRAEIAAQTTARIAEIERTLADQTAHLIASVAAEESRAYERVETMIATTIQDTVDKEAAIIEEANRRREDLERDHRNTLQRINRNYNREAANAASRLDAIALIAAQQNRDDQLSEEEQRYREGQRQLEQALDDQLKENRKANDQRITELRQSYQREAADRRTAINTRLSELQAAAQAEIDLLRQKSAAEIAALEANARDETSARNEQFAKELQMLGVHYQNLNELTSQGLSAIAQQFADLYSAIAAMGSGSSGGSSGGGGTEKPPEQLATGVRNFRGGMALVGERGPELAYLARGTNIYSNRDTRRMLGSITFSEGSIVINTRSNDAKGIMREIKRQLPDLMADELEKIG